MSDKQWPKGYQGLGTYMDDETPVIVLLEE